MLELEIMMKGYDSVTNGYDSVTRSYRREVIKSITKDYKEYNEKL